MSLVPFVTAYMGNNHRDPRAVGLYGAVLFLCGLAFTFLRSAILCHVRDDPAAEDYHRGMQRKNLLSSALYVAAIPLAFVDVRISYFIYAFVALSYFLPDASWPSAKSMIPGGRRPPNLGSGSNSNCHPEQVEATGGRRARRRNPERERSEWTRDLSAARDLASRAVRRGFCDE